MHACPHGWIRLIGQYAAAYFVKCFGTGKKRPRGGPPGKAPRRGRAGDALPQQGAFCARPVLRGGKTLSFPQRDKRQGYTLAPYA